MNNLTDRELLSRYKSGRNTIYTKKSNITNIIEMTQGISNRQAITLSNFPFDFGTIFIIFLINNHLMLEKQLG